MLIAILDTDPLAQPRDIDTFLTLESKKENFEENLDLSSSDFSSSEEDVPMVQVGRAPLASAPSLPPTLQIPSSNSAASKKAVTTTSSRVSATKLQANNAAAQSTDEEETSALDVEMEFVSMKPKTKGKKFVMQCAEPPVQEQAKPTKGNANTQAQVRPKHLAKPKAPDVPMDVDAVDVLKPKGQKPKPRAIKKPIIPAAASEDSVVAVDEPGPSRCVLRKRN